MKRRVYFNEFNVLMDNTAYLPLVSGLLRAYAETFPAIKDAYEFMPFLYARGPAGPIIDTHEAPAVAAFSVSMWNEQLNLAVATEVKRRHPECLIVFGGPQVPHHPAAYFAAYPFIDVAVRVEGEEAFSEILLRALSSREFGGIAGVAWRNAAGACVRNVEERERAKDLDAYPSPYLEGLFDDLMRGRPFTFQAIVEGNRGCPFPCTFCFWGGGGLLRKFRFHSIDRLAREIEWCAQHKIAYVFNADSNFGQHPRDSEIATMLVQTKEKYGFPEKFRTCFGKNTDDRIFDIASLLHAHGMEKGITLARQSNDAEVLKNIKRQNIKLSTYESLQRRFNEKEIPVYSELILGLPGETWETWTAGIEEMLQAGLKNQLFVYLLQVYPNTEMADPAYQEKFGIRTKRLRLTEIHAGIRTGELVDEFEDVVIQTNSMSLADWRRMARFSWMLMALHSLKLGFFVTAYLVRRFGVRFVDFIGFLSDGRFTGAPTIRRELDRQDAQLDSLLAGNGRGHELPEFGRIYWDEEEALFLRVTDDLDTFYRDLEECARQFLGDRPFDAAELREAVVYQKSVIPHRPGADAPNTHFFNWNFPEFFASLFKSAAPLRREPQGMHVQTRAFDGLKDYAKRTILWGRKSGTMLNVVRWWSTAPVDRHDSD